MSLLKRLLKEAAEIDAESGPTNESGFPELSEVYIWQKQGDFPPEFLDTLDKWFAYNDQGVGDAWGQNKKVLKDLYFDIQRMKDSKPLTPVEVAQVEKHIETASSTHLAGLDKFLKAEAAAAEIMLAKSMANENDILKGRKHNAHVDEADKVDSNEPFARLYRYEDFLDDAESILKSYGNFGFLVLRYHLDIYGLMFKAVSAKGGQVAMKFYLYRYPQEGTIRGGQTFFAVGRDAAEKLNAAVKMM